MAAPTLAGHASESLLARELVQLDPATLAVFILKADVEAADDRKLAELEIEGLTGSPPRPVTVAAREGRWAELVEGIAGSGVDRERLLLGRVGTDPVALVRRLGMIEEIHIERAAEPLVPEQVSFERLAGATGAERVGVTPANRRKNEYLTHSLHKYKAKFFPRMARALANYTRAQDGRLLDPFAGSGTLLLEASLMGIPSDGIDVDPLSVFISQMKVEALGISTLEFDQATAAFFAHFRPAGDQGSLFDEDGERPGFGLPEFIGRKMGDGRASIEAEVADIRGAIGRMPARPSTALLRLALSHAVATKISLRWMGTGDNRFALSIAKRSVHQIMRSHLTKMRVALVQRDALMAQGLLALDRLGEARVQIGDVRTLPFADEVYSGIVTSPPYLPASSGRETYLRSRAPSLVALDLLTEREVLERDQSMIGSILRSLNGQQTILPQEVMDLVEWMKPQRARAPKALPTAVYFHDLAASLREMGRVLKRGGRLAVVVSTAHIFYDLITRKTVRQISMPDMIAQLIDEPRNEIPLKLDRVVQVELPKMDYAARPASRGNYSESIVIASRV